jgi:hypothetical protein
VKFQESLYFSIKTYFRPMAIFRQYVAPFLILLVFLVALLAVSSRIFLASDMAAPASIEEVGAATSSSIQAPNSESVAGLPPSLSTLIKGLPDDPALF